MAKHWRWWRRTTAHVCAFENIFVLDHQRRHNLCMIGILRALLQSCVLQFIDSSTNSNLRFLSLGFTLRIQLNAQTWRLAFKGCDYDVLIGRYRSPTLPKLWMYERDSITRTLRKSYGLRCHIVPSVAKIIIWLNVIRTFAMGSSHGHRLWIPQFWISGIQRILTWTKWA